MATTGATYKLYLQQKLDQAYSTYFDDTKWNRLIKESFYRSVEKKYLDLRAQKEYDEIRNFIGNNVLVGLSNGRLYLDALQITTVTASGVGTVTVVVNTKKPHYLEIDDRVTTSGILGFTFTINGNAAVTTVNSATEFEYEIAGTAGGSHTPDTGIVTPDSAIVDYYHYLYSEVLMLYPSINVSSVVTGTTTSITTSSPHYLRSGDNVLIENVAGVTGINTTHASINVLNTTKFSIGTTTGIYTGSGSVQRSKYESSRFRRSDQKGFVYTDPSNDFPKHTIGDGILFYDPSSSSVIIDYIKEIPFEIDVTDDVVDLENWYPFKFLSYIADEIILNAGAQIRDVEIQQSAASAIVENP